jgi:DNA excision repair protein ERCC-4
MTRPRKDLEPRDVTIVCDTREQLPFTLDPLKMIRGTLPTGDYGILGLEHVAAVERKSVQDLVSCIPRDEDGGSRFMREMKRLLAYETRAVVVEGSQASIELKQYRGDVHPNAVMGAVYGIIAMGIPVMFCGDRERAQQFTARLLFIAARRRWREAQLFIPTLRVVGQEAEA